MRTLRLGVVGCGAISTLYHLPALRETSGIRLAALVDRDRDWAARLAKNYRVPFVTADHRELAGVVDAALVATPNSTHKEIVCELFDAGIHVLCEKPVAPRLEDAQEMFVAAERTGRALMAAHCLRFNANVSALREWLHEEGRLGGSYRMVGEIGGPYQFGQHRTDFRRDPGLAGGGVLLDLGIHLIDIFLWLFGSPPERIEYAAQNADGWALETDIELCMRCASGTEASISASYTRFLGRGIRVFGASGWISAPLYQPDELTIFDREARVCACDGAQRILLPAVSPYAKQLEHFRDVVFGVCEALVRPSEVLAGLSVINECYAAIGRGADAGFGWKTSTVRLSS